jgi:rSAM/selenodomain-associated transferase 2
MVYSGQAKTEGKREVAVSGRPVYRVAAPAASPAPEPAISVIVPVLDDAGALARTLDALRLQDPPPFEVVVADGGSSDDSRRVAARSGARVIAAPPGRGSQLRAGACAARGDVLLFLHADTRLPPRGFAEVAGALEDPAVDGGRFRLAYDRRHPVLRLIELGSRCSATWASYGDSGFFVRRSAYDRTGGFEAIPIFEDVRFYRALKRHGAVRVLPASVTTSARRFVERGPLRQLLANAALVIAHRMGVSPERLARLYAGRPPRRGER